MPPELISLAYALAARYARPLGVALEDVEAAALVGAWRAARSYDPARDTAPATWAWRRIQWAIQDEVRRLRGRQRRRPLGEGLRRDRPQRIELVADPVDHQAEAEARDELAHVLRRVPWREREVLYQALGRGETLAATGARLGVSESRAGQLRDQALRRLGGR